MGWIGVGDVLGGEEDDVEGAVYGVGDGVVVVGRGNGGTSGSGVAGLVLVEFIVISASSGYPKPSQ